MAFLNLGAIELYQKTKPKCNTKRPLTAEDREKNRQRANQLYLQQKQEAQQRRKILQEKQFQENQHRYPKLYMLLQSVDFENWFEALTGQAWDHSIDYDVDEVKLRLLNEQRFLDWKEGKMSSVEEEKNWRLCQEMSCIDKNIKGSQRYRAMLMLSTPKWSNLKAIEAIYAERDRRNKEYSGIGPFQVDHIVPIQGRTVCGLHVPANLRVIPAQENMRKGSSFCKSYLLK